MPSVPSVTMKGSMRPLVIRRPCARPNTAPSTTASTAPSTTASSGEPSAGPIALMNMITQPAINAAIEPTDRSMPPEMITKHMPTAMMPMKAVRVSTFIALSRVAKSPLSRVPAMHSSTRPMTGPKPCRRSVQRGWTTGRWAAASASALGSGSGGMSDELLFGEIDGVERGDQPAGAHHRDAVAQADQLHQFGRDDDHGQPLAGQSLDQEIDVALGADVNATRRLVEHHHLRLRLQHLGQRQLLLVAAGQRGGTGVEVAGADAVVLHGPGQRGAFGVGLEPGLGIAFQRHQREVLAQAQVDVQALALAVLAQVGQAMAGGVARIAEVAHMAPDLDRAAARAQAQHALEQLGAAGADQAGE